MPKQQKRMADQLAAKVLELVGASEGPVSSLELSKSANVSHQEMIGALNSLIARDVRAILSADAC